MRIAHSIIATTSASLVSLVSLASLASLALVLGACAGDDTASGGTETESETAATAATTGGDLTTEAGATDASAGSTDDGATAGESETDPTTSTTGDPTTGDPTTSTTSTTTSTTTGDPTTGDDTGVLPEGCSAEAAELVTLVNAYRAENGKPAIPLSPSLCTVGAIHAEDLAVNAPHADPACNLHSWSDAGPWTACCYTSDHAQAQCMWDKPRELTIYPGNGYENSAWSGGGITPTQALEMWKKSPGHNAVILSEGIWKDFPWGAVGAGFYEGYAMLWFGQEPDPAD